MSRSGRFFGQLLLLPILYFTSLPDQLAFANVVSLLLIVVFTVNLTVALILEWTVREARRVWKGDESKVPQSLVEAADNAWTRVLMASGAVLAALISLAVNIGIVVPGRPFVSVLAWILLLNVVPAVGWAARWRDEWLPAIRHRLHQ